MIKAVIFSLDDTLYPEKEYVESGFLEVAKYLAGYFNELNEVEVYCHLITIFQTGVRGNNIFNLVLDVLNVPQNNGLIQELVQVYQEHLPRINPYPDCLPNLIKLKKKGYLLGIITDGWAEAQRKKIDALGIVDYFNSIIYTDDYGGEDRRPAQYPYQLSLSELKIFSDQALYVVGDKPSKNFVGARALGLYTILISRRGEKHRGVRMETFCSEADAVTYSLSGLWKIIRWLQSWHNLCTTGRLVQTPRLPEYRFKVGKHKIQL
ncbi:MAG: HAD hydrolase-like protein [bacterium]